MTKYGILIKDKGDKTMLIDDFGFWSRWKTQWQLQMN